MRLENDYTDIFTEVDESIFSDGSIDPLGLRMIWTSLGNKIFQNRLNTISTNIRFYTLNLFHHAVIREVQRRLDEKVVNLTGKAPYDNRSDLYDGIIIFLECLLAHVIAGQPLNDQDSPDLFIPGISKLKGILVNRQGDRVATQLPVDRKEGILVRHILLGVHGRHKGPFQQMGILHKQDYYADARLWEEVLLLFQSGAWRQLFSDLVRIIDQHILSAKPHGGKSLWVKLAEIKTDALVATYNNALRKENFQSTAFIRFWEQQLGLSDENSTAGIIYAYIRDKQGQVNYQETLEVLSRRHENADLRAIMAIEPLFTCVQKVMDRLLQRGTTGIEVPLQAFVQGHIDNPAINPGAMAPFIAEPFFNQEAQRRLRGLLEIYQSCVAPANPDDFIHKLIRFHHDIMKQRGNLPWMAISNSGSITQHRSFYYSESITKSLKTYDWVNDYYLNTVTSLYIGLYQ
jgi:hypothetical protein